MKTLTEITASQTDQGSSTHSSGPFEGLFYWSNECTQFTGSAKPAVKLFQALAGVKGTALQTVGQALKMPSVAQHILQSPLHAMLAVEGRAPNVLERLIGKLVR
jgi:hypothetical protein